MRFRLEQLSDLSSVCEANGISAPSVRLVMVMMMTRVVVGVELDRSHSAR